MILENSTRQGKLQNDDERLNELNFCIERGRTLSSKLARSTSSGCRDSTVLWSLSVQHIPLFYIYTPGHLISPLSLSLKWKLVKFRF